MLSILLFIQIWQAMHNILICLDANDNPTTRTDHRMEWILAEMAFVDFHWFQFPDRATLASHNYGSKTINFCLGTQGFAQALTRAWMLPFGQPATLAGNHCELGLEFDHDMLFGNKLPNSSIIHQQKVYSNAYPMLQKFNDTVTQECTWQGLFQAEHLSLKYTFTQEDHDALEHIDHDLIAILVKADHQYTKYRSYPWSPKLHQAFLHHCYWSIHLNQEHTQCDYLAILNNKSAQMKQPPATVLQDKPS